MSTASSTPTKQHRYLVSPDGMCGAWVHPLDPANPKHAGWVDCTDMSNEAFHKFVAERQAVRPHIVGVAAGA